MIGFSDKVQVELIRDIPSVLWVAFALAVVLLFRRQLSTLLPTLRSLKLPGGIEAEFGAAVSAASAARHVSLSGGQRSRLIGRIRRNAGVFVGAHVLWIDDHSEWTANERGALELLGVEIRLAESDDDARVALGEASFDLLISDIDRAGDPQAGIAFARLLRAEHHGLPILFYVERLDTNLPVPREAFGLTNRPDELVHLVLDILERRRG